MGLPRSERNRSPAGARSLAFASACAAGVLLAAPAGPEAAVTLLALLALAAALPAHRTPPFRIFLALALGAASVSLHACRDGTAGLARLIARAAPGPVGLRARLLEVETLPESRAALLVDLERYALPGGDRDWRLPPGDARLRLTVPLDPAGGEPPWRPGDLLEMSARVSPPRRFANPGSFDYAAHLAARGIGLVGSIKNARLIEVLPGRGRPWLDLLPALRREIVARLRRAAGPGPGGEGTASFLAAILVGERGDLPAELEERLLRAGVYHIIALSGLNVGLVALLVGGAFRLLPLRQGRRHALAAVAVALYWGVARPGGSIARAALMVLLQLSAGGLRRRVPPLATLSVSGLLLLLARPANAFDVGFQLTFSATLGILLLGRRRTPAGETPGRPGGTLFRWVRTSLRTSAAALAATALCTAHHFHTMTAAALAANLFAIPIAGVLLVLAFAIAILPSLASGAAALLASVAGAAIDLLGRLCALVSRPPGASFFVLPPAGALALWGSALVVIIGQAPRAAVRRAAFAALLGGLAWTAAAGRQGSGPGELQLVALDVGQGDALLVRLPAGITMLIDAGGFARSEFDVGAKVVGPALRSLGRLRLDILTVTHAHRDHLGGAAAILRQFHPGALWLGRMPPGDPSVGALERLAEEEGTAVVRPRRGVLLRTGGALLEILNPGAGVPERTQAANDDSLVMRITFGRRSVLLTGDLEAPLEAVLVREGRGLSATLLKVGHHGSRTSTTAPFLARVGPRLAVVSVGASNPWGHPDPEVLGRLAAAGARVYRTDRDGAVRFRTDGLAPWSAARLAPPGAQEADGISAPRRSVAE